VTQVKNGALIDTTTYRRTMGLFATGVTVLATHTADGDVVGMTANAVTSVSLEPMLLLVCVGKQASIAPHLLSAEGFTLSILSIEQQPLSEYFARLWKEIEPPPFNFEDWDGQPRLSGALGAIACRRHDVLDGGDHWIVLGEVTHLHMAGDHASPLIFYKGQYRMLAGMDEHKDETP
jgi:flavin reductase (DIM6/NTAB) family NADH-FMN oxidoreductase RutF